ncbi:RING [Musa troglodytarum]|uniref:RING n=1 Tax=Musa troglodytarum TaxID=320322 RepID=A0A9E7HH01_9LILI|nr:RING [Musa troglodytarum]
MEGSELLQSVTPSENADSSDLSEPLEVREEDDTQPSCGRGSGDFACEKREGSASGGLHGDGKRLFDIIQQVRNADGDSGNGSRWRSLTDRLRHTGAALSAVSSSQPCPISDPELVVSARSNTVRCRSVSLSVSVRNSEPPVQEPMAVAVAAEEPPAVGKEISGGHKTSTGDTDDSWAPAAAPSKEEEEEEEEEEEQQPAKMSLMALLEQTDMQWGGSDEELEAEEEEEEEEEEVAQDKAEAGGDGMLYVCCVCMVRHKGAAFIPCGHTFCRLCSRELWVSRGNCPLCNGYILEILDIF